MLAPASGAQTAAPLGERIGDTLDAEEQAYFGLFPSLDAPTPYRFAAAGDSVRVTHADSTLLTLPRDHADRLAHLVETFEDFASVADNPSWEPSAAFVRYIDGRTPIPRARSSRAVRAVTPEGSYSGFILYTTDSLLVMAPEVHPRDPSLPGAYAMPRADLMALDRAFARRWQRWGPLLGMGVGTLVGSTLFTSADRVALGSFGALAGYTIGGVATELVGGGMVEYDPASIEELAYFNGPRPPEMPSPSAAAALATAPRPAPTPAPRRLRSFEWVSVGIHGSVQTTDAEQAPIDVITPRSLESELMIRRNLAQLREPLTVPNRLDVSVRPIKWARFGMYFGEYASGDSLYNDPKREQITRSFGSRRPYAEAILPLFRAGDRRLEVFGGGGRHTYSVSASQAAPATVTLGIPVSSQNDTFPLVPANISVSGSGEAWFYTLGAEAYTSRFTSLFVRHTWHPLPTLDIDPFVNVYTRDTSITLRTVEAHAVDFSYRELTFGARFHL